jgi:hypothetical protein
MRFAGSASAHFELMAVIIADLPALATGRWSSAAVPLTKP